MVSAAAQAPVEFSSRRERREAEQTRKVATAPRSGSPRTGSPRRQPRSEPRSKRSIVGQFASVSALVGVFALLVSTSLPANAFYTSEEAEAVAAGSGRASAAAPIASLNAQDVKVNVEAATAAASTEVVARDSYEAKSFQQQITPLRGNPNLTYSNNPNGAVQWPFPGPVPISSGFGPRAVCSYCSTYHLGLDFTPGAGVPIQAIADGVVSAVEVNGGGFGNHVTIDHVINGQRVQTLYAHMAWGSVEVAVGQAITVGSTIGKVGSTGNSTGAHLHFEVHLDGTPVDPYVWLKANAL